MRYLILILSMFVLFSPMKSVAGSPQHTAIGHQDTLSMSACDVITPEMAMADVSRPLSSLNEQLYSDNLEQATEVPRRVFYPHAATTTTTTLTTSSRSQDIRDSMQAKHYAGAREAVPRYLC